MLDELVIGAPQWAAPAALGAAVLAGLVVWGYVRAARGGALAGVAILLKLAAIGLLAACLVEPLRSGTRPRPQANLFPIVVDNSQSMRIESVGGRGERQRRLERLLDEQSSWRTRLEQDFDVRPYAFDARLRRADDLHSLPFDGTSSAMLTSLRTVAERFRERPVAGLLLVSDGNHTDPVSQWEEIASLGFPVYPVIDAEDLATRDLRIDDVGVSQTNFEASPVTVAARVAASGLEGSPVVVQLTDEGGELVEEQTVEAPADGETADVRFRFRPDESGVQFYELAVLLDAERKRFAQGETRTEATLENNRRVVAVDRGIGPYRVLYVAGRPNWEFKFLRRAVQEDAEVQLVGLLRMADKEPRFSFRDSRTGSTNPLFSGLGEDAEEAAEQYDEPVMIRLGIGDADELSDGFPSSADELFGYDAVVLDDLEAAFFTQDQMLLLRRFVSARGGGVLMLGGPGTLAYGGYAQTPLADLAPVYLDRSSSGGQEEPVRLQLTREGMLQPWLRLRTTEANEQQRLAAMPAFKTFTRPGRIKPGASVLAYATRRGGGPLPAVVTQRLGKGQTAAILFGDLWRWSMRAGEEGREEPAQAWRQTIRWLVSDVPRRVEASIEEPDGGGDAPVTIRVAARDDEYLPMDNATVKLEIDTPDGDVVPLTVAPSDERPGEFVGNYTARRRGGYRARVAVSAADGSEVGRDEAGWAHEGSAAEFRRLATDRELLQRIAEATGGEVVDAAGLGRFVADLPNRKVPVTEQWIYPLWHRPWVLALAVLCLCGEWGLRRWKGLP